MYSFVYYINTIGLYWRGKSGEWRERRVTCQQLIGNIEHVKKYRNFKREMLRFFSGLEILVKHRRKYLIVKHHQGILPCQITGVKRIIFCFLQMHSLFCHRYPILCVKPLFLRCYFCRNIYDSSFSNIPEGELNKLKNLSIM